MMQSSARTLPSSRRPSAASKGPGPAAQRSYRRYLLAWLGLALLGPLNGIARELLYREPLGESASHQVSSLTAIALFAIYTFLIERPWPLPNRRVAVGVGAIWLVLTIAFEFSFGRFVDGKGWDELFADYNLVRGRLWPLVLLWLAISPEIVRALLASRTSNTTSG